MQVYAKVVSKIERKFIERLAYFDKAEIENELKDKFERFTKKLFLEFFRIYSEELRPSTMFELSSDTYTKVFECAFKDVKDKELYMIAFTEAMNEINSFSEEIARCFYKYLANFVCEKPFKRANEDDLIEYYSYLDLNKAIESQAKRDSLYLLFEDSFLEKERRVTNYFEITEEKFIQAYELAKEHHTKYSEDVFEFLKIVIENERYEEAFLILLKELYAQRKVILFLFANQIYGKELPQTQQIKGVRL